MQVSTESGQARGLALEEKLQVIAACFVETQWEQVIALTHQISQPLDILGYWDERVELADGALGRAEARALELAKVGLPVEAQAE